MIAAIVYILLMVVVFIMAEKRKRNAFGWTALSLFISPFIVILALFCIGDNE